jgi:hypothetical protein
LFRLDSTKMPRLRRWKKAAHVPTISQPFMAGICAERSEKVPRRTAERLFCPRRGCGIWLDDEPHFFSLITGAGRCKVGQQMVDRESRARLVKVIRSYMAEEMTAFQFDDVRTEICSATSDKTVKNIGKTLWFYYDDCKDHKIVASKEVWDLLNRLLLLLESDGELETTKTWREWHPTQCVAALSVFLFVIIAFKVGFGEQLLAYALPFGPLSMLIAWHNAQQRRKTTNPIECALTPFPTMGSLFAVRRLVGGFKKVYYPKSIASRRIRDPIIDNLMWIPRSLAWCMFSPVALFFQALPRKRSEIRIAVP